MRRNTTTKEREMKLENGEVVKITEEEFQKAVDVFKMLSDWNRELLFEAINGSKVSLRRIPPLQMKKYVGKKIFVAVTVKEEVQLKHWDFYYKLEKVTLDGYNTRTKLAEIKAHNGDTLTLEPRDFFVECQMDSQSKI